MWYCYITELHAYDFVIKDFVIKKECYLRQTLCKEIQQRVILTGLLLALCGLYKDSSYPQDVYGIVGCTPITGGWLKTEFEWRNKEKKNVSQLIAYIQTEGTIITCK